MNKSLKIAITGTNTFLERSILHHFSELPHCVELRVLTPKGFSPGGLSKKTRVFKGELTEKEIVQDLVHGTDAVLHLRYNGDTVIIPTQSSSYLKQALAETTTLLEAMVFERVPRILFASSGSALYKYDPSRKVPFHEGSEIEFRSAAALSQMFAEQLLQYYKKTFEINPVILRFSTLFGRFLVESTEENIIGDLFARALNNEEVKVVGHLDIVKDFIYIDDVFRVIDGFLQHRELQGIFNVGSGMGVSLREVITVLERLSHRKLRLSFSTNPVTEIPWSVLNTSKLQRSLNWTCRHSVQDGFRLIWEQMILDKHREHQAA